MCILIKFTEMTHITDTAVLNVEWLCHDPEVLVSWIVILWEEKEGFATVAVLEKVDIPLECSSVCGENYSALAGWTAIMLPSAS